METRPIYTSVILDVLDRCILSAIAEYTAEHGYPPTVREIAAMVGKKVSWTQRRLVVLEGRALPMVIRTSSPRTIQLTTAGKMMVSDELCAS